MCEKEEADEGEIERKSDGPGYYSQLLLLLDEICFCVDSLCRFMLTVNARPLVTLRERNRRFKWKQTDQVCYLTLASPLLSRFITVFPMAEAAQRDLSFFGILHFETGGDTETPYEHRQHTGMHVGFQLLMYGFGICQ